MRKFSLSLLYRTLAYSELPKYAFLYVTISVTNFITFLKLSLFSHCQLFDVYFNNDNKFNRAYLLFVLLYTKTLLQFPAMSKPTSGYAGN